MHHPEEDETTEVDENLPDVIPTKTGKQLKKGEKPLSSTWDVVCPDCSCDYLMPCIKMTFTKSFAGNKIQNHWPEREASNDTALVGCPNCGIIFRIAPDGQTKKIEGKTWRKKGK